MFRLVLFTLKQEGKKIYIYFPLWFYFYGKSKVRGEQQDKEWTREMERPLGIAFCARLLTASRRPRVKRPPGASAAHRRVTSDEEEQESIRLGNQMEMGGQSPEREPGPK